MGTTSLSRALIILMSLVALFVVAVCNNKNDKAPFSNVDLLAVLHRAKTILFRLVAVCCLNWIKNEWRSFDDDIFKAGDDDATEQKTETESLESSDLTTARRKLRSSISSAPNKTEVNLWKTVLATNATFNVAPRHSFVLESPLENGR